MRGSIQSIKAKNNRELINNFPIVSSFSVVQCEYFIASSQSIIITIARSILGPICEPASNTSLGHLYRPFDFLRRLFDTKKVRVVSKNYNVSFHFLVFELCEAEFEYGDVVMFVLTGRW